ncbi:MAG: hypothetical protein KGI71_00410 [Patescibacteria group bacterium]|nr:hypothetical protein [Patescibacteria group bacterium]
MDQPLDQPFVSTDGAPAQQPATPSQGSRKNTFVAAMSYFGPLVVVSYVLAKKDSFVMFHIRQAAVLFCIEVALWVLTSFFWPLWLFWQLINLGIFVLAIIGIVHAVQSEETELPLVGHLAVHIPL